MRKTLRARIQIVDGRARVIPEQHLHPSVFEASYGHQGAFPISWEMAENAFEFDYDPRTPHLNCMEHWLKHFDYKIVFSPGDVTNSSHEPDTVYPDDPID